MSVVGQFDLISQKYDNQHRFLSVLRRLLRIRRTRVKRKSAPFPQKHQNTRFGRGHRSYDPIHLLGVCRTQPVRRDSRPLRDSRREYKLAARSGIFKGGMRVRTPRLRRNLYRKIAAAKGARISPYFPPVARAQSRTPRREPRNCPIKPHLTTPQPDRPVGRRGRINVPT